MMFQDKVNSSSSISVSLIYANLIDYTNVCNTTCAQYSRLLISEYYSMVYANIVPTTGRRLQSAFNLLTMDLICSRWLVYWMILTICLGLVYGTKKNPHYIL